MSFNAAVHATAGFAKAGIPFLSYITGALVRKTIICSSVTTRECSQVQQIQGMSNWMRAVELISGVRLGAGCVRFGYFASLLGHVCSAEAFRKLRCNLTQFCAQRDKQTSVTSICVFADNCSRHEGKSGDLVEQSGHGGALAQAFKSVSARILESVPSVCKRMFLCASIRVTRNDSCAWTSLSGL